MSGQHERRGGSFYGRRKGKQMRPGQREALDSVLPRLLLDPRSPPPPDLAALFETPLRAFRLEIGFGGGEHLLHQARAYPETGFVGVEPFENGMAKAATAIAAEDIRNIRLYDQDAALLLDWLPARSLERVDLLYPDPWPKKRHWKRRFVNAENLKRIARCLTPDGIFRFATDIESYVEWTLEAVGGNAGFEAEDRDTAEPWEDWPSTRYEAKALREGRRPTYLSFRRTG